mgnify:CR=1 FL=1
MKKSKINHLKIMFIIIVAIILLLIINQNYKISNNKFNKINQTKQLQNQTKDEFYEARKYMVDNHMRARDIYDEKVLAVMEKVPRHRFVPANLVANAYDDRPLPIGYGQTISQPYIVALMTQELNVGKNDKVLEIGTGSGYQAAVLAELVKEVYTIEIVEPLAKSAEERLKHEDYKNVKVKHADGYFGWQEKAPFDAIIVTAAVNHIPPPLIEQLKDGGRLIIPLGSTREFQTLTLVTKKDNDLETRFITGVVFVPLTGEAQRRG